MIRAFCLMTSLLLSLTVLASGTGVGNGGDAVVLDFVMHGTKIVNFLKRHPDVAKTTGLHADQPFLELRKVSVQSVEHA